MTVIALILALSTTLTPAKTWFAPDRPALVHVKTETPATLVMTDFVGRSIDPQGDAKIAAEKDVDLRALFPAMQVGTYLLYEVPEGKIYPEFVGTPLVVSIRGDKRPGAPQGPMVVKIEPLKYVVMDTEAGPLTMAFYYDVAPNTVTSFLGLIEGGYFDDTVFHRVVPGFVIQGGDPLGRIPDRAGGGNPGFNVSAEFNDRPHIPGVLSMARQGDPIEQQGAMPRSDAANSAGSQFFICLDYKRTQQLDGRYTAFGRVTDGMDAVNKIGSAKVADPQTGRPETPQVVKSAKIYDVEPGKNPYARLFATENSAPATRPAQ